jgi:hypothetical protein
VNLNEVRYIISRFTDRADAPEEFDARINFGHNKNFSIQWEAKNWDALRPFKVVRGGDTPPLYVTNGYSTLPSDYFGRASATVFYQGEEKPVEFLEDLDFDDRKSNPIEYPSIEYPIGNIQSARIRFLPKSLQYVNFSYIRSPEWVHFGYTNLRGFVEYDPVTSVELPWDDENTVAIILMVLSDMGIQATPDQVKKARG